MVYGRIEFLVRTIADVISDEGVEYNGWNVSFLIPCDRSHNRRIHCGTTSTIH